MGLLVLACTGLRPPTDLPPALEGAAVPAAGGLSAPCALQPGGGQPTSRGEPVVTG